MPIPSSRFPVPGSQFPVPGSQFPVPSSRFPVPGSQFPVPGSQFPVPGSPVGLDFRLTPMPSSPVFHPSLVRLEPQLSSFHRGVAAPVRSKYSSSLPMVIFQEAAKPLPRAHRTFSRTSDRKKNEVPLPLLRTLPVKMRLELKKRTSERRLPKKD